ncbi:hypothetical protein G159_16280 [Planococcus glaciei CHR43]|uniref:glycosyltransferase n=1 Tax=Planococcus glaciei TaxID=459472 RepID=UPI0003DEFAD6|nr:glycosyltransferase [Planococcus glaciei]ETP67656.1 hypothetical protein G159_16280 [Planococcus glaciei CHR43]
MKSQFTMDFSQNLRGNLNKPLISVMVAIYNAEKYLEKCIESIINQTYGNLEIILINDGSTDNSGKICEEYKKKDNRIIVIHKENKGLSDTRNVGLQIATGDFLGFVDSDDWIMPEMYEKLMAICIKYDAEISQCESFTDIKEITKDEKLKVSIMERKEYMPLILTDAMPSQVWRNIYKKDLFENIKFPKDYSVQDMMIFHLVANKANKIVKTNEKLYYYFATRTDNISNNKKGLFKGTMCRALAFSDRYIFSLKLYPEAKDVLLKKAVRFIIASFCRETKRDTEKYKEEMKQLYEFLRSYRLEIKESKSISLLEKISVEMILLNKSFFVTVCKVLRIK